MPDKKHTDKDYLFLSTMLKARSSTFLSTEVLERMLSSSDFDEAARILSERGWQDMSGMDRESVDNALSKRREDIFSELIRYIPDRDLVDLFRLRYDYHNAKAVIKGQAMGTDAEKMLSDAGRVPVAQLKEAFFSEDYRFIPAKLGEAMAKARDMLARSANPQLSDFVLDSASYAEMTDIAKKLDNKFITDYVRLSIDGANLRACVRCLRMGKNREFLAGVLIDGGNIARHRLEQTVTSADGIVPAFAGTPYKEAAALGAEATKGGKLTQFELKCDNVLMRYLRGAKMQGFGPEMVAGYLAACENDIVAARMVLNGLRTGMDTERIRERLRDTYV